jgi:hypothetical protein
MVKAAQKTSSEININLMPRMGPPGTFGTAIQWVLTTGRYLIIATEIIAIVIFVLGIKLSADKNDLKERIKNLSGQISSQNKFETEFRAVQKQINEIKREKTAHFPDNLVVDEFLKLLPQGITLKSLEIKEGKVVFSGEFSSPSQLQTLVASFSESKKITGLDITELNSPSEKNPVYSFTAKATIVQATIKKESEVKK